MADNVERDYVRPILDEDLPPAGAAGPAGGGPLIAGFAPMTPFALHGCVLTPDTVIEKGWVDITGGTITRVGTGVPGPGIRRLETDGIILPGLIDLHGHPEYNVFAPWEPPMLFANRGRWRASPGYDALVKLPLANLKAAPSLQKSLTRYAEARALIGGTTAIQGTNGTFSNLEESLVRNVDRWIFGGHKARSIIDLDRTPPADITKLLGQISAGDVNAVYIHLAEGVDATSRSEFAALKTAKMLTKTTVIIHGTALEDADLDEIAASGAKLVWSPQSNLRLYGATTKAGLARQKGIPIGLGADWQPSGSPSLLAEMKVARRALIEEGRPATARDLVRMVTIDAAAIAGLSGHLGLLAKDRPADVLVLERHDSDPWEAVLDAYPSAVELVELGGDIAYGRLDWARDLADVAAGAPDPAGTERAIAWGKTMLLDLRYSVRVQAVPPPRLADLRAELIGRDPRIGPIFA
ncbi:MAG: amidohydrolase family protein [Sporichthyaceae bacterium]